MDKNVATEENLSDYELGLIYECGSDHITVDSIDVVLSEWFELGDEVYFDDLMTYLPKTYLKHDGERDRHYYSDDGDLEMNIYEEKWEKFITGIRHSHRFFNPNAEGFLDAVFGMLTEVDMKLKPDLVRTITKGALLYRARAAQTFDVAKKIMDSPSTELGPTPKDKASSQRMTPSGISALYCALERETCLSEIRSITGDNVVSGALTPTTELKLLDLTKLELVEPPKLTIFDVGYRDSLHLKTFIKSMVTKMSKPKGRNDDLSYLSTQVVFEYLRLKFRKQVDGLIFPSVQTGEVGTNVVLFPEVSVISKEFYNPNELTEFFVNDKLAVVDKSLRFHRVTAIKTSAIEHDNIYELFMSDLVRTRLELPAR
ncbi:MAG: RES family NAD+ phosphorylase [Alphaproteobacteria bacterium]|nr:RES family NAD+ phosphorylase [Alphaproteobacteria bacterium]